MKPKSYILHIHTRLLNDSIVVRYRFVRERATDSDTFIRGRIVLMDGSFLDISEYGEGNESGNIQVVKYSYQWMSADKQLLVRWDNAKHYPTLPGFPHHRHDGDEQNVLPGEPVSLFAVLDEIAARLRRQ